jgi:hypothetical protein
MLQIATFLCGIQINISIQSTCRKELNRIKETSLMLLAAIIADSIAVQKSA